MRNPAPSRCGMKSELGTLHAAAEVGDKQTVEQLLLQGYDVNQKSYIEEDLFERQTPLHLAAWEGHGHVVETLLNHKANVNEEDHEGKTALHLAAQRGHSQAVEILLAYNAKIDQKDKLGCTPLQLAADFPHKDVIFQLLVHKANVNEKDLDGKTQLHIAAERGTKDLAELLIKNKANVNEKDLDGQTALHIAAWEDHYGIVELLLHHQANVNDQDFEGDTPLHAAASEDNAEIAELLIKSGANVNETNFKGETALHHAARESLEVIEVLRCNGADITCRTLEGETASDVALRLGHYKILSLLKKSQLQQKMKPNHVCIMVSCQDIDIKEDISVESSTVVSATGLPAGSQIVSEIFTLKPHAVKFFCPVIVRLPIDLSGQCNPKSLRILYRDEESQWQILKPDDLDIGWLFYTGFCLLSMRHFCQVGVLETKSETGESKDMALKALLFASYNVETKLAKLVVTFACLCQNGHVQILAEKKYGKAIHEQQIHVHAERGDVEISVEQNPFCSNWKAIDNLQAQPISKTLLLNLCHLNHLPPTAIFYLRHSGEVHPDCLMKAVVKQPTKTGGNSQMTQLTWFLGEDLHKPASGFKSFLNTITSLPTKLFSAAGKQNVPTSAEEYAASSTQTEHTSSDTCSYFSEQHCVGQELPMEGEASEDSFHSNESEGYISAEDSCPEASVSNKPTQKSVLKNSDNQQHLPGSDSLFKAVVDQNKTENAEKTFESQCQMTLHSEMSQLSLSKETNATQAVDKALSVVKLPMNASGALQRLCTISNTDQRQLVINQTTINITTQQATKKNKDSLAIEYETWPQGFGEDFIHYLQPLLTHLDENEDTVKDIAEAAGISTSRNTLDGKFLVQAWFLANKEKYPDKQRIWINLLMLLDRMKQDEAVDLLLLALEKEMLQKNTSRFLPRLKRQERFVTSLWSCGALRDQEELDTIRKPSQKWEYLIREVVLKGNKVTFEVFKQTLDETNQQEMLRLITVDRKKYCTEEDT